MTPEELDFMKVTGARLSKDEQDFMKATEGRVSGRKATKPAQPPDAGLTAQEIAQIEKDSIAALGPDAAEPGGEQIEQQAPQRSYFGEIGETLKPGRFIERQGGLRPEEVSSPAVVQTEMPPGYPPSPRTTYAYDPQTKKYVAPPEPMSLQSDQVREDDVTGMAKSALYGAARGGLVVPEKLAGLGSFLGDTLASAVDEDVRPNPNAYEEGKREFLSEEARLSEKHPESYGISSGVSSAAPIGAFGKLGIAGKVAKAGTSTGLRAPAASTLGAAAEGAAFGTTAGALSSESDTIAGRAEDALTSGALGALAGAGGELTTGRFIEGAPGRAAEKLRKLAMSSEKTGVVAAKSYRDRFAPMKKDFDALAKRPDVKDALKAPTAAEKIQKLQAVISKEFEPRAQDMKDAQELIGKPKSSSALADEALNFKVKGATNSELEALNGNPAKGDFGVRGQVAELIQKRGATLKGGKKGTQGMTLADLRGLLTDVKKTVMERAPNPMRGKTDAELAERLLRGMYRARLTQVHNADRALAANIRSQDRLAAALSRVIDAQKTVLSTEQSAGMGIGAHMVEAAKKTNPMSRVWAAASDAAKGLGSAVTDKIAGPLAEAAAKGDRRAQALILLVKKGIPQNVAQSYAKKFRGEGLERARAEQEENTARESLNPELRGGSM